MAAGTLPTFEQLKKNYLTGPGFAKVKADIGGDVTQGWLGDNTCVIRMSKPFNYAAGARFAIPGGRAGMLTVKGADKLNYAIRVVEFIDYLGAQYGAADIVKLGEAIEVEPFLGKTGIIAWSVNGWEMPAATSPFETAGKASTWAATTTGPCPKRNFRPWPASRPLI